MGHIIREGADVTVEGKEWQVKEVEKNGRVENFVYGLEHLTVTLVLERKYTDQELIEKGFVRRGK